MSARDKARSAFLDRFGSAPAGIAFAPGRVNLIGEHVDYNDGLVFPMPIASGTAVAWSAGGETIEAFAADLASADSFAPTRPDKPAEPGWQSYLRGMVAHWPEPMGGLRLAIAGDLPRGAGLSSSASLCVALGRAFAAAAGEGPEAAELARIAQRTEHDYAGVACGIMDQMAVAAGEPGHAMLLDCRDLAYRQVAIPDGWRVAVVESGVTRGLVDGEYNARRAQCEQAAETLGLASLRDATLTDVEAAPLDPVVRRRARHVVSEIARTAAAAAALERRDIETFGRLLDESHASLRDDFEVSVEAVDRLVDGLQQAIGTRGGARMTGAGFGGAVVAVFDKARTDAVSQAAGDCPTMLL